MSDRQRLQNLPTEIIRTLISVVETGSHLKASARLGISQSAVTSQIKRIESLLGGSIFRKEANGSTVTKFGFLVLSQARRMMEAHDQMLRLRGHGHVYVAAPIRVGISNLYTDEYLKRCNKDFISKVIIHADTSAVIAKKLADGFIDIAYIFQNAEVANDMADFIIDEHEDLFVWTCSEDFLLNPGVPIPLLSCTGTVTDDLMFTCLSRAGLDYSIVFNSADYRATISAARAGLGFTIVPVHMIPDALIEAKMRYLPALTPVKAFLYARPDAQRNAETTDVLADLLKLFFVKPVKTDFSRAEASPVIAAESIFL